MSGNPIVGPKFATQALMFQDEAAMKRYLHGLSGTLSATDLQTLTALRDAAKTHTEGGRFSDARVIYGQLLSTCERLLGGKHVFTLSVVTALGDMYCGQGDTKKALHIYRRALAGLEETLGMTHPETLATVATLGMVHLKQDEFGAALPLLLRLVAGLEDVHGAEHPAPLVIVAIVASVYTVVVDPDASAFVETALGRMERVFGEHHPLTKETRINLALVLLKQGRFGQAWDVFEQAMEDGVDSGEAVGSGEEEVNRPKQWQCGRLLLALGMLLGMIYCFPMCTVVVGVLLGSYFLPRGVIVGGTLLGLYFFSRRESMA